MQAADLYLCFTIKGGRTALMAPQGLCSVTAMTASAEDGREHWLLLVITPTLWVMSQTSNPYLQAPITYPGYRLMGEYVQRLVLHV